MSIINTFVSFLCIIGSSESFDYTNYALLDLVTELPGLYWQPNFNQFSGYLNLRGTEKYIHYWLTESESNPETDQKTKVFLKRIEQQEAARSVGVLDLCISLYKRHTQQIHHTGVNKCNYIVNTCRKIVHHQYRQQDLIMARHARYISRL